MTEEVENPLTTLLKKRYGITRRSNLTITDKDTPFSTFRKVAAYIYRNGDWSENDQSQAIKDYLELSGMEHKVLSVKRTSTGASKIGSAASGKDVFEVQTQSSDNKLQTQYFVLDEDNKSWNRQGNRYTHRNRDGVFWYEGNLNYTIGYGKLLRDVYNQWLRSPYKYHDGVELDDFKERMQNFVRHEYAGKKWEFLFKPEIADSLTVKEMEAATEPNHDEHDSNGRIFKQSFLDDHPDFKRAYGDGTHYFYPRFQLASHIKWVALTFVNDYLRSTYNIVQQQHYEHDLEKETHARAWETKKDINKATQQVMDKTTLHKFFKGIELDNDVDLTQFKRFEDETMRLMARLPKTKNVPILRLRKLGNHKAAGLYVPSLNTIVVDFRNPSEIHSNHAAKGEQASFSSFIHEYGHYLDYNLSKNKDDLSLSLQPKFANIIRNYTQELRLNGVAGKDYAYLATPTEVFARSFELYMHDAVGLRGNLNHSNYDQVEYKAFTPKTRTTITKYFDQIPEIKVLRKTLNIDTSREIDPHLHDERQNSPELADKEKLAEFSKDLLHHWTKEIPSMEDLITMSGRRLELANPTKVIAFDQWGIKAPQLVSQYELHQKGISAKRFPKVEYIRGYSQQKDGHWLPDRLYSVPQLKEAMLNDNRSLDQLHEIVNRKGPSTGKKDIITKIVDKKFKDHPATTPLTRIQEHVTKYLLVQNHLTEEERYPFHFKPDERQLLSQLADISKTKIFQKALRNSWKQEPQLERELQYGIKHPLIKDKQQSPLIKDKQKSPQHNDQLSLNLLNQGRER